MKTVTFAQLDETESRCVREVILPLWGLISDSDMCDEETEIISKVRKRLSEKTALWNAEQLGDLIWSLVELQAIVHLQSQKSWWENLQMPEAAGLAEMRKVEYLAIRDLNRALVRHLRENFTTTLPIL